MSPTSVETSFVASTRLNRWCWALAVSLTIVWFAVYAPRVGDGFCDEPGHLGIMRHFHEGQPGWPESLPHPPGYHFVVLWLTPGAPNPIAARAVTVLFSFGLFAAFAGAWRQLHGTPAGPFVLLLMLLPILQPYTAMIYTDVPALALLMAAWWAQLARRPWLAGLLLAATCLIRQTAIVWGTFFLAREFWLATQHSTGNSALRRWANALLTALGRGKGVFLVHGLVALVVIVTGRLTPGTQHGNALEPNLATVHFGAVLIALLGLPLWLRALPATTAAVTLHTRRHPFVVSLVIATSLAAVVALALNYRNPHNWNHELWWDNPPFTLLRNWPLVYADRWPFLRWVWSALAVLMVLALTRAACLQRHGADLAWASCFGAVLLATNGLVEPRYFITPIVFWLFFIKWDARQWTLLVSWFALLCVVHAPFIARKLSLW